MPKKMYVMEPAVFFDNLLEETREAQGEGEPKFTVQTSDPIYKSFITELLNEHYPPQSELPLLDA